MNDIIKLIGLLLFALVIGMAALSRRYPPNNAQSARSPQSFISAWLWSVGGFLFACIALVLIVDPRGYFYPAGILPPNADISRQANLLYYPNLPYEPDILILGSSRAMNMMDSQMRSIVGLSSYNAAVTSGQPIEIPIFLRYLRDHPELPFPPVLLVELTPGLDGTITPYSSGWPLSSWVYLPDSVRRMVLETRLIAPFSLNNIVNALMQVSYASVGGLEEDAHDPDIGSERMIIYLDPATYEDRFRGEIDHYRDYLFSPTMSPDVLAVINEVISMAEEHKSSVVFYLTPYHPVVYSEGLAQNPTFMTCYQVTLDYFETLPDLYPHVSFIDLTQPDGIESLTDSIYFFDGWHPNPEFFDWLVPQMREVLQAAYQRAIQLRETEA